MVVTIGSGPNRRARLRRLALAAFLGFCTISAVMHFTLGSIIAALLPKEAPVADQIAQKISILTIYRLVPDRRAPRPVPVQQQVAQLEQPKPKPQQFQVVKTPAHTTFAGAPVASAIDPLHPPALSQSSRAARSSSSAAMATSPNGMTQAQPGSGPGQVGNTSGEELNFPGRQMPSGAVWTENGPPGTSTSAGGEVLTGGSGGGVGGHDSCAPGRGDFF